MGGSAPRGARARESATRREHSAASPPIPTFPQPVGAGRHSSAGGGEGVAMHATSLTRAKLLTLAIGIPGGALFYALNLPLPWMLGAMATTTLAAISGVRIALMPGLRLVFVAILGVMLGSAFTPEVVQGLVLWLGSFAWLGLYVVVATAGVWLFYRRLARYDAVTAYFSAAPGGLNEMILAGGALGGDERRISMSHAARVLIAIFAISFGYR